MAHFRYPQVLQKKDRWKERKKEGRQKRRRKTKKLIEKENWRLNISLASNIISLFSSSILVYDQRFRK
jgi:hypothetical protein